MGNDKEDAKKCLDAITSEGRVISINIKICDAKKAEELLGTMYDKNIEQFGVAVQSWGFWDIQKANALRIKAMTAEVDRHQQEMQNLINKRDQDYLEETDGS